MNNDSEMQLTQDLLRIKRILRNFSQTSYSMKKFEERFPDIEFSTSEEILQYIKISLAFRNEIEETLDELKVFYDKYAVKK
jgi:hypothetical protein